jgi:OOP family OmpA-OmpF porin
MDNLVDMGREALKGESITRISSTLHESERGIRQGFADAVPLSIAGLANQVDSEDRARTLLDGFRSGRVPQLDPADLDRAVADPNAADRVVSASGPLLGQAFGNRLDTIVDGMASDSGLRRTSASKLLGLATPLVMGMVGKLALARHLDPRGLLGFLGEQRRFAAGALPAGLAGLLGPTVGSDWERARLPRMVEIPHRQVASSRSWLPWVLAAVAVLALVSWAGFRRVPQQMDVARAPVVTEPSAPAPTEALPAPTPSPAAPPAATTPAAPPAVGTEPAAAPQQGAPVTQPMPESLQAGAGMQALNVLIEGTDTLPQNFVLSGLEFRFNSTELEPSSAAILDDVATTLKAHTSATILIEGHTDSIGSPAANTQVSTARAHAAKDYLVDQGVESDRIEAVGVGAERPVADNDTPEGRAQNRRTELVLTGR